MLCLHGSFKDMYTLIQNRYITHRMHSAKGVAIRRRCSASKIDVFVPTSPFVLLTIFSIGGMIDRCNRGISAHHRAFIFGSPFIQSLHPTYANDGYVSLDTGHYHSLKSAPRTN